MASARARPTRLRIPPLNSEGILYSTSGSPTEWSVSRTISRISRFFFFVCSRRGKATFSATVMESKRAASWNSIPNFFLTSFSFLSLMAVMSVPSTRTRPLSGLRRPIMCFRTTLFPPPLRPMMTVVLPRSTWRFNPFKTFCFPKDL